MKNLLLISILLVSAACSTTRTKFSDKNMRVMINPEGLSEVEYMDIQSQLVNIGTFTVIDRSRGIQAIKKEQKEMHVTEKDRYADREKFAHWGKLYGVGSVIVAHSECQNRANAWNRGELRNYCRLFISLIDTNTGEVMISANGEDKAEFMQRPSWEDTVEELVGKYPEYFESDKTHDKLNEYKDESAKLAKK